MIARSMVLVILGFLIGAASAATVLAHTADYGDAPNYDPGHPHKDNVDGNGGEDILEGMEDDDTLRGGTDNDYVQGMNGDDDLYGGDGPDRLIGDGGDDRLDGGTGAEAYIFGGQFGTGGGHGNDILQGGSANDILYAEGDGGNTPDFVRGEDGFDRCYVDDGQEHSTASCEIQF